MAKKPALPQMNPMAAMMGGAVPAPAAPKGPAPFAIPAKAKKKKGKKKKGGKFGKKK